MLIDINLNTLNLKEWIEQSAGILHFDTLIILAADTATRRFFTMQSYGGHQNDEARLSAHCGRMADIFKHEQKCVLIKDDVVYQNEVFSKLSGENEAELYIPFIKIMNHGSAVIGLALMAWKSAPDNKILTGEVFRGLVGQLYAIIISRYELARKKESSYQIAYLLAELVDIKEPYQISRLFNIAQWCEKIAIEMGLPQTDIDKLQIAALMHNLGKIYISEDILNKAGKLTDDEYKAVKKIVEYSYDISLKLQDLYEIEDLPEIILHYQERVDGTGYPHGIKGEEIPLLSKILGAAKAVSSMLTNSPYRTAKTIEETIIELKQNSNTQFDEKVANAAIAVLTKRSKINEACFTGIGSFATFHVKNTRDGETESINMWGDVRKAKNAYFFTPIAKIINYDSLVIQSCDLYVPHTALYSPY